MLTRTVRLQVCAFVIIAVLGVSYVAVRYVGLTSLIGDSGYTVHLDLPSGGGIFSNAEVDYRGVPVGRVGAMTLTATGVAVDLHITSSRQIPSDTVAVVADGSVIGEQYVDLRPRTAAGPYLHSGSRLTGTSADLPPSVNALLVSTDQLVESVPISALQTVVDQVYAATDNTGADLQTLLTETKSVLATATAHLPGTLDLINAAKSVLATQEADSSEITTFSANLALIAAQLKSSDSDLRTLLDTGSQAATDVTGLVQQVGGSLGSLLSGLLTTSTVLVKQHDALRELLVQLPVTVSIGGAVVTPLGINVGLVPTFFDPLPCTAGYGSTTTHQGTDTTSSALNTSAGCTAPTSSGQDERGSQHAPGN